MLREQAAGYSYRFKRLHRFSKHTYISSKLGIEGLPLDYNHERQAALVEGEALEEMFYGGKVDKKKSHQKMALEAVESLNEDQKAAFEEIKASIMDKSRGKRLFFIEGSGGCGIAFEFINNICLHFWSLR